MASNKRTYLVHPESSKIVGVVSTSVGLDNGYGGVTIRQHGARRFPVQLRGMGRKGEEVGARQRRH